MRICRDCFVPNCGVKYLVNKSQQDNVHASNERHHVLKHSQVSLQQELYTNYERKKKRSYRFVTHLLYRCEVAAILILELAV